MRITKATGWRPIVQDWRYRQSERGENTVNVYMMPHEPGKAVSNADFKEPSEEGVLKGGDMLWLRRMVREEYRAELERALDQAVERFFARGLDNLMTAIKEPRDEQEEIAAVLATLTTEQLEAVIARVRESQQS